MKFLVSVIVLLMITMAAFSAFATTQFPDKIVYDGKKYNLRTYPMEPYFDKHPDKRPGGGVSSTALYRGYIATFEFNNNVLVLKDIEIENMPKIVNGIAYLSRQSVKNEIITKGENLTIDWFTGILVLPHGKLLERALLGNSKYSNYLLLEIKNGELTDKRFFDYKQYEEFKKKQFQAFKKTEAYKKLVKSMKGEGDTQESIDSFLLEFIFDEFIFEFQL